MKVLIIGGYGTFGFGIAERLMDEDGLQLFLAGRNLKKAQAACAKLSGQAICTPLLVDRNAFELDFKPDLIVDASGPFQTYSVRKLVDYCIQNEIHYADLSDYSAGVLFAKTLYSLYPSPDLMAETFNPTISEAIGFREMTEEVGFQKATGDERPTGEVFLGFGLSTCPVLSAIGIREIEAAIGQATKVTIGIAPSPKADLGQNVIGAVLNYAGQARVGILEKGEIKTIAGLTETRHETICVPGDVPLPRLSFAVADAADALILTDNFPGLKYIWTGAGTRPIWLQRVLVFISRGISDGIMPKLNRFTNIFYRVKLLLRFGEHRGGMFVRGSNYTGEASWHLVAEGDHGPRIPALPVVALIRRMLRGDTPKPGAYSGDELIGLDDLAPEFSNLNIAYGLHFDSADLPVYEKIMGDSYARLLPAVQELHRTWTGPKDLTPRKFAGRCDVIRGRNLLTNLVANIVGFPKSGRDVPVTIEITPDSTGETWVRTFGISRFKSHHSLGRGRSARVMTEKFGPISIHMAILEEAGKMRIETQSWSFFGVPLPGFLRPGGDVYETQDAQGRFVFHVDLIIPIFGRLCKYVGWFVPEDTKPKAG